MKHFSKFINSRAGHIIWLVLICVFTYRIQNVPLLLIVTAGMAWLAMAYDKKLDQSRHKKIWKLLAILLPFVTYLIFVLKAEKDFLTSKQAIVICLLLNAIFLITTIWFSYSIIYQQTLENDFAAEHKKLIEIEADIDTRGNSIDKAYLNTLELQQQTAKKLLFTSRNMGSAIFYKYIPEYKTAINTQIYHLEHYVSKAGIDAEWARESLKQPADENKMSTLLERSNAELDILQASLENVNRESNRIEERVKIGKTLMDQIVTFFALSGTILTTYILFMLTKKIIAKNILISLGWLSLGIINILALLILASVAL